MQNYSSGQILEERFEIVEEIGEGGVSTVFQAFDLILKRKLAIKLLKAEKLDERNLIRLQREAKAICQLNHPNIIDVYDFIIGEDNVPIMAMAYVEGESLKVLLERMGHIEMSRSLAIFKQIISALSYAHSVHILHRDLKPGNVLISDFDGLCQVEIIDFGIAKFTDLEEGNTTGSGSFCGTPGYISPEQAQSKKVDVRSDVYSMGCLMYKTLTGRAPFVAQGAMEVIDMQINQVAPSLKEGNDSLNFAQGLENIVARALRKNPEDRFQSMDELGKALEELSLALQEEEAAESSESKPAQKQKIFMKPMTPVLMAVLVVVPLLFIGIFYLYKDKTNDIQQKRIYTKFQIREQNNIDFKYVFDKKNKWHIVKGDDKGRIRDSQLEALDDLEVNRLVLAGTGVTDDQLKKLAHLPLLILDLRNTFISDRGIESIAKMESIQSLLLGGCSGITSNGIKKLAEMKNLKILDLGGTHVSNEDLKELAKLSDLMVLYVNDSPNIGNGAIEQILKMDNLISIRLGGTRVTREAVDRLQNHKELRYIGLRRLDLCHEKMPSFSKEITMLDFAYSNVDSQTLIEVLNQCPKLWFLDIRKCKNLSERGYQVAFNRLSHGQGKVVLYEDLDPLDIEWYLDPESYTNNMLITRESRKKLMEYVYYGDPKIN